MQLQILIAHISFIEEQISQLDAKITESLKQLSSPITTIPGIGTVIGATIISEFGDIKRFATPAKLVAFAGLDSKIDQSGTSQDSTGKMTKRGSPYIRHFFAPFLSLLTSILFLKLSIRRKNPKANIT